MEADVTGQGTHNGENWLWLRFLLRVVTIFSWAACEAVAIAAIPCGLMRVPGVDSHRLQLLFQGRCINSFAFLLAASVFRPQSHDRHPADGRLDSLPRLWFLDAETLSV